MAEATLQIHATSVDLDGTGVLLKGEPGAGKSDLALRLIDGGGRLVSDDRSDLRVQGGRLIARAPLALRDLLEVRGIGIVPVGALESTEIGLVVDLVPAERIDRMPTPKAENLLDLSIPLLKLAPFEASAPSKVRLAARMVAQGILSVS